MSKIVHLVILALGFKLTTSRTRDYFHIHYTKGTRRANDWAYLMKECQSYDCRTTFRPFHLDLGNFRIFSHEPWRAEYEASLIAELV